MEQSVTRQPIELAAFVDGWAPKPVESVDVVQPDQVVQLSRTLDFDESRLGHEVPILVHWTAFQEWPATARLGPDGHPADGHFYPPIPHRRRMFAGATVKAHSPFLCGVETVKRTSVASVTPKRGSSGEMVFVELRDEFRQNGALCRTESQHVVYRSDDGKSTRAFDHCVSQVKPTADATWAATRSVAAPTLFRYSALTANAHRIHYDAPYAVEVEGYPGLVVHGPLLAMLMAELIGSAWGDSSIGEFSFRLKNPVFVDDPIVVEGHPVEGDMAAELEVRTAASVAATGRAVRK